MQTHIMHSLSKQSFVCAVTCQSFFCGKQFQSLFNRSLRAIDRKMKSLNSINARGRLLIAQNQLSTYVRIILVLLMMSIVLVFWSRKSSIQSSSWSKKYFGNVHFRSKINHLTWTAEKLAITKGEGTGDISSKDKKASTEDNNSDVDPPSLLNLKSLPNAQQQKDLIQYVKENRLFPYDAALPTDYNFETNPNWGKHSKKQWKKTMSNFILNRLNNKTGGFFVECGALDGVFISNTLLLEQSYNWTGLLIEADIAHTPTLKKRNRKAWVADVCLSPKPWPMQVEMKGHNTAAMGHGYIENDVIESNRKYGDSKYYRRKFNVQCIPFETLMDAVNRTQVDYFSLDVEGVELDILKTIPFNKFQIQLISVEIRPTNKNEVRLFLESLGYKYIEEIRSNSDFIHDHVYELQNNAPHNIVSVS